jgi:iron complex outermembrane receptor protein
MRSVAVSAAVSAVLYSFSLGAQAQSTQSSSEAPAPAPAESQNPGSSANAVEEVVVTGFRQSLAEGIELKREAVGVRDSIVAEDIGKFPEQNVAESLQRIPGVFLSRDGASNEGQRISIRGLGSQYSLTTINGAPVRTTSSQNVGSSTRDFNFDVFPSELFGRVDIYKTPQASLEEGGIGGNVDLQTPRAFDSNERVIRYGGAYNYNSQSEELTPRGSFLVSDTWGNFGALLGVAYAKNINERSGFQSTGGYNTSALGQRPYLGQTTPNTFGPYQFQLNFNDPRVNLGNLTRQQVENAFLPRFYRVFTSNNERERLGSVASLQFKTDRLDISLDGIFSKLEDAPEEFTFGVAVRNSRTVPGTTAAPGTAGNNGLVPIDVRIDQYNNLYGTFANASYLGESFYRNSQTDFKYGILRGAYDLTDTLKLSAQLNASDSNAWYSENRIFYNIYGVNSTFDPTGNVSYPTISSPADYTNPRSYSAADLGFALNREVDRQATGRMQLDWDAGEFAGIDWSTLVGVSRVATTKIVQRQDGTSLAKSRTLPTGGTFATLDVFSYMNPNIQYGSLENGGNAGYPSQFATFPRSFVMNFLDANGANAAAPVRLNQAFDTEETVSAAYFEVNGTTDIAGHELRGNVGVRYADTEVVINNYYSVGNGQFAPQEIEGGYDNWLPSLSLAFDITQDLVVRGSAGKTITRAALVNIASGTVVPNIFNAEITVGNPNLEPQIATQYDLGLEWYFAPGGLLSGGVFKKSLDGTATRVVDLVTLGSTGLPDSAFNALALGYPSGDIPDDLLLRRTRFVNQGIIDLKGIELAYQQTFNFLPAPFDGLGTILSYTNVDTQGYNYVTTEGRSISVALVPETAYSLTAYYEKGPFAVRTSYNYRGKSVPDGSQINNGNDQIPYNSELGFLDASISYRFNDALEVRVDALNLTNENTYLYYEDPDGPSGNGSSRRDNSFFNGRTFSLGIRGGF